VETITQIFNVWRIDAYLPTSTIKKSTKSIQIYHAWSIWVVFRFQPLVYMPGEAYQHAQARELPNADPLVTWHHKNHQRIEI